MKTRWVEADIEILLGADQSLQTKLFISSEVPIFQIFSDDRGKAASDDSHMRSGASPSPRLVSMELTYSCSHGRSRARLPRGRALGANTRVGSECR